MDKENPKKFDPVSPINVFAGEKLNGKNPTSAPASAVIKTIDTSGEPFKTNITNIKDVSVSIAFFVVYGFYLSFWGMFSSRLLSLLFQTSDGNDINSICSFVRYLCSCNRRITKHRFFSERIAVANLIEGHHASYSVFLRLQSIIFQLF